MATVDRILPSPPPAVTPSGGPPAHPPGVHAPARPGWLATFFLSALALLLASFPARNSDLWQHLAAGRQLARGEFSFGPSWLYDLLGYGLYSALGGAGLVFAKALLVVLLALVLLRLGRSAPGSWLPAACTALALLVMGTRLLLQPAIVSYLLLALTLALLHPRADEEGRRAGADPPSSGAGLVRLWPLLVLFVLWVNVDSWFVLGLATVTLVWLGRLLDLAGRSEEGRGDSFVVRTAYFLLSLALLAGVCLLNPSGVRAFDLPRGLAWWGPARHVTSPFGGAYFAGYGLSPAGLAYFPLLLLGLLSFVLNLPGWRWARFLPWLALALLSAFQARAIPFFAVVAGPVLAWNLGEALARPGAREDPLWRQATVLGRALAVVAGLALLVCAWPGWLQVALHDAPRVGEPRRWAVETQPSLERGAEETRRWRREGKLGPDPRGLYLSAEAASAFAWFCPEEDGVVDEGLASAVRGDPGAPEDWAERMRSAGINHVVLYDTDPGRLCATMDRLLEDPGQWPLLYVEGYLAVFGWRDPDAPAEADPFRGKQLDLNSLAFHPPEDKKAPRAPSPREPEARRWWDAFWKPLRPRPLDQEEATLHLSHAEFLRRSAPRRHHVRWVGSQCAALVGVAAGWAGPGDLLNARVHLNLLSPLTPAAGSSYGSLPPLDQAALVLHYQSDLRGDDTSPALLYLAVRAARRALAVHPDDAQAHLVLGESYLQLLRRTRERVWGGPGRLRELGELRRAQASAALNQAVQLKPDLARAHLSLGGLYQEMGYLDLTLKHLRTYLDVARKAGAPAEDVAAQFRDEVGWSPEEIGRLAEEVAKREDRFTVASAGRPVPDRALAAWELGLKGKARDILLASDISAFALKGTALELELLLRTGRPRDVLDWSETLSPERKERLGGNYYWVRTQAAAAAGEYALAQEECNELYRSVAPGRQGKEPAPFREVMARLVARRVLEEQPGGRPLPELLRRAYDRMQFSNALTGLSEALKREADVTVLRGLLALEEGDVVEAEVAFKEALSSWKDEKTAATGGGLDFNGRPIAQACAKWLE